jgi:hypothetical protein
MASLQDIYRYRQIASRCESGDELSMEEIQLLSGTDCSSKKTNARVMLRGPRVADWVDVTELGPVGLLCHACPWMEEGQAYEVIFEDVDGKDSFRFKAIVDWTRDSGDDLDVCLRFTGGAVHVRRPPRGTAKEPADSLLTRFAA